VWRPYLPSLSIDGEEFERLGGEAWTQSFRIRLGLLANKLFAELYGKKPPKVRSSTKPDWRNKVCKYPCGILDQAFRKLRAEYRSRGEQADKPVEPSPPEGPHSLT
jgi:hypothetical protein